MNETPNKGNLDDGSPLVGLLTIPARSVSAAAPAETAPATDSRGNPPMADRATPGDWDTGAPPSYARDMHGGAMPSTTVVTTFARTRRKRSALCAMRVARRLPLPRRMKEHVASRVVMRLLVFEYRTGTGPWKRIPLRSH